MRAVPITHELYEWRWHNFAPLAREENYVPILTVLANHDRALIAEARDSVNQEVDALALGIGLGLRVGEPHADIFRNRFDVWRFTGSVYEPGLCGDEIRLTPLG